MYSEAALDTDPEFIKLMTKITRKNSQLKTSGMTLDDREILEERLGFTLSDAPEDTNGTSVTVWRKKKARKAYKTIQDANADLFFTVILAITPTECSKPVFKKVKESLLSLKSYENYRLNMDFEEKHCFEVIAAEQGFMNNHRYLSFMNSLFPQG